MSYGNVLCMISQLPRRKCLRIHRVYAFGVTYSDFRVICCAAGGRDCCYANSGHSGVGVLDS